ncbi:hypothetical protein ACFQY4_43850 [Catellatospora bangladeshensis]|uniref:Uncharacterized protein n=1 Tax=Catellatospora bangladeshensis TaxID=310355 RepID=A0A8J3JRE2_9ACTN|nr:hypothetical protein [Catellatospora bangladeshensis]GIF82444.1 hypothetical protein Cba03nite_37930 [Catellatospora bangladeshensis]
MLAQLGRIVGTLVLAYVVFQVGLLALTMTFGRSPELVIPPLILAGVTVWWFLLRRGSERRQH